MMAKSNKEPQKLGIPGLPPIWSVAVQLIGTFGLAVFLVLYYLFVMGPEENKRYDEFNKSINKHNTSITELTEKVKNLAAVVKDDQIILKENQSNQLEELFTKCVAYKIADSIFKYKDYPDHFLNILEVKKKLENTLIINTELAEGLLYADGRDIAVVLKDKILKSKIAQHFADYLYAEAKGDEWSLPNRDVLSNLIRSDILFVIRR
jgi:hypothetical protein